MCVTMKTTDLGLLQYKAFIPIDSEVRITFSYMSLVYNEPRMARREFLQTNKGFQYECKRCIGFDECNHSNVTNAKKNPCLKQDQKVGFIVVYCAAMKLGRMNILRSK